jgi:hypothetical protein
MRPFGISPSTREQWAAAHPEGSWAEIRRLQQEILQAQNQTRIRATGFQIVSLDDLQTLFSEPKADVWPPPNWALYGPQNWREYKQPVSVGRFDERRFLEYCEEYDRRPEVAAAQRKARERARVADERAAKIMVGVPPDEIYPNKPAQPEGVPQGVPDIIIKAFRQDFLAGGVAALKTRTSRDRYRRMSKAQREGVRRWLMHGANGHG